jgi:serine/threonine protein kinase
MLNAPHPPPGTILGRKYRIECTLGEGGMGVVYRARHARLDERVAIKMLRVTSASAVARFMFEAKAAMKIRGQHVVRVFDVDVDPDSGAPYIVMEHLDGEDVGAFVQQNGVVPPSLAAAWILEACEALAEAHALGIVHRDLKPTNLFLALQADGTHAIKVLDFGISKLVDRPSDEGPTEQGTAIGTPPYMAPEQLMAGTIDARTDIWALGAILFEVVEGTLPFADISAQLSGATRTFTRPVPESYAAIITKCLAVDPKSRFATVAELARVLAPLRDAKEVRTADRIGALLRHRADLEETAVVALGGPTTTTLASSASSSDAAPLVGADLAHAETEDAPTAPRVRHQPDTFEAISGDEATRPVRNGRRLLAAIVASALVAVGVATLRLTQSGSSSAAPPKAPSAAPRAPVTNSSEAPVAAPLPFSPSPSPSPSSAAASVTLRPSSEPARPPKFSKPPPKAKPKSNEDI